MLASFCSSLDLTECNKGDQASHAPQHNAHPLPQQHQRCGQSCGVQSHQQLMRQRFRHQYQRSRVPLTAFLHDTIFSARPHICNYGNSLYTKSPQGSKLALFRTTSAAVTVVFSMLIPVSEKKLLCVNRG